MGLSRSGLENDSHLSLGKTLRERASHPEIQTGKHKQDRPEAVPLSGYAASEWDEDKAPHFSA